MFRGNGQVQLQFIKTNRSDLTVAASCGSEHLTICSQMSA
jgi:hypothetical protein